MITTKCLRCSSKKKDVVITGSYLCDVCQDEEFERLRNLVNGDENVKSNYERVNELSEQGLKPREIANRLGISIATVYTYRKNNKPTAKTQKSVDWESKYNESVKQLSKEQEKFARLNSSYKDLLQEKNRLENQLEKQLAKSILEKTNKEEQVTFEKEYLHEKRKHDALLQYLFLIQEGTNEPR